MRKIIIALIAFVLVSLSVLARGVIDRENRFARKGQNVVCDLMFPRSTIQGKIVYEEDEYIVVSGSSTNFGFTGGEEVYKECEGCSVGVQNIEVVGAEKTVTTGYSERYVLKKYECIRQGRYKNQDIVKQMKNYIGEETKE